MKAKFVFFQLALLSLMLTSCMSKHGVIKMCSARAQMDFSKGKVVLYKDIRTSLLLGDGDEWIILDFSKKGSENIEEEIKQSPNWIYFNQNDELKNYCYSKDYFDVPEEGYFCIIDWQQPKENRFDYSLINSKERHSSNYTIMIYDPSAKKLYSYSLDT